MSAVGLSGNTNSFGDGIQPKKPDRPTIIKIADIDDSLDNNATSAAFKKQVSEQLELPEDKIEISINKLGMSAKVADSKPISIQFEDKADLSRISKMSAHSSAPVMSLFGDEQNNRVIKIPNYPNGFTKEQDLDRFKNDIAREMGTEQRNIEVFAAGDEIVAKKKNSEERHIVKFNDSKDGERFLDYAKDSPSRRLADFGIKKHEGEVRTGFSTNVRDPKNGSNITTGFTYGTFIGDHQRVVVNANMAQNPAQPFSMNSLQNASITYQNLDVPFLGDFGSVTLKYDNGKLGFDGKSDAIDVMADDFGKKYVAGIKEGDPKAIMQTAGALGIVAGGLFLAKEYLPERKEFDLPIKARVYGNGTHKINAIVAPTIGVGGKQLDFGLSKAGIEAEQNIASGQQFRERVIYDFKDKSIEARVQATYNNFYGSAEGKYSIESPEKNRASIQLGYNQILNDKSSINYYAAQTFDKDYKPTDSTLNVGYSYRPSQNWTINTGVGLGRNAATEDKLGVNVGASIAYRF